MAELQGRKILCARDAAVHVRALPAKARGETLFLLLLLGVINLD